MGVCVWPTLFHTLDKCTCNLLECHRVRRSLLCVLHLFIHLVLFSVLWQMSALGNVNFYYSIYMPFELSSRAHSQHKRSTSNDHHFRHSSKIRISWTLGYALHNRGAIQLWHYFFMNYRKLQWLMRMTFKWEGMHFLVTLRNQQNNLASNCVWNINVFPYVTILLNEVYTSVPPQRIK